MRARPLVAAVVIGLALGCAVQFASAQQIYKWKDANGVIHFSQTPPANGHNYKQMTLTGQPEVSSNPPPAAASTDTAGGSGTPPAPNQPVADTPANRAKLCKQLVTNIGLLTSQQPLVTAGAGGKQQVMSDDAREQQLATARAQQKQYCSTTSSG
ncbi:MAG TPA: DUF4124 domain-containing protein [Rhodanobacteraceae bacterium]|nr:DUF4124 domain-containing protein [Rhodanobacteraceae bacterium]